ncbi:MAG: hypothetical protein KIT84_10480 [Labilithrix sp.]|nr:hypothetical protein [Labilithrix sp.]MCW5811431.1 hypothetical protein [Labilithrix sp.]
MTRFYLAALAGALVHCGAPDRPAPVVVPPAPAPVALAPVVEAPKATAAPSRAVLFTGPGGFIGAAWVSNGIVAVTRTEVWRFTPEKPELVRITPLAGPASTNEVITATSASPLVAVALDDSSVDILDDTARKRTLPPPSKPTDILALRFSPDQTTIAVTRTGATWKNETTFYDVASGNVLGAIDGANVVFDPSGKYVAGRGGVSSVDGKALSTFKEGFYVLDINGRMSPMGSGGGEVMAGDYVARGFYGATAFYAASKTVELVEVPGGKTASIGASCSPGRKLGSEADAEGARVIGVCDDGVLLTDLASKKTTKLKFRIPNPGIFPPEVHVPRGAADFMVRSGATRFVVLPQQGVVRAASYDEIQGYASRTHPIQCVKEGTPRSDNRCDLPTFRADNAYSLKLSDGLVVRDPKGNAVVDWSRPKTQQLDAEWTYHRGALELRQRKQRTLLARLDGAPAGAPDPGEPFSADGCGKAPSKSGWSGHGRNDAYAAFTDYKSAKDFVTAQVVCICRAEGCTTSDLPNSHRLDESLVSVGDDGSILTISINNTMTETQVYLRRAKKPALHARIPASCIYGAIGAGGRVFMSCEAKQRLFIYELSPKDLSLVGKRSAPPVGRHMGSIVSAGDDFVLSSGYEAAVLPGDFVTNPASVPRAILEVAPDFVIQLAQDGKVTIAGDVEAASKQLHCYDGAQLWPFDHCRQEVLVHR